MKKAGVILLVLLILVGGGFGYVQYKKSTAEKYVLEYLNKEKNIPETDIVYSEPFIANLPGNKNWMVCIKLKGDDKTYYYYYDQNQVFLESYTEDGVEHVQ
ncbi:hypothetical protein [Virgibacillus halodenitrificans]|uniref:hypothetical protein n=1 Tax=Virgibacillus halodenitrificans TaxID=1482 RepID=UPI001F2B2F76|nr:hypothetical protein [Virgibacillus halodenitrificans]